MDRNYYYVGIAFFGMINGLFNQALVPFSYLFVKVLAPALLFGSESLTLMFASLMASTATVIAGGIPAALYERFVGAKDDSTEASLWKFLPGRVVATRGQDAVSLRPLAPGVQHPGAILSRMRWW
jgi:hypothetical protein